MGTVDLGDVPSPRRNPIALSPILPSPATGVSPVLPQATSRSPDRQHLPSPRAPPSAPQPFHQGSPRRGSRKHARQRSPSPLPRQRGNSYRPRPTTPNTRGSDCRNHWSNTSATNPWSTPSDSHNPWAQSSEPSGWPAPNAFSAGLTPPPWGAAPGYMPWGVNPTAPAPWSVHYPGYYPTDHIPMPSWPPFGFPPAPTPPTHGCPSCHSCASCGRPSLPGNDDDQRERPSEKVTLPLLGRLQSPSPMDPPRVTSIPLAQRLWNPTPLAERLRPPPSLAQRMQGPPPEFVQGSSSGPLRSSMPNPLQHRMTTAPGVVSTRRARRSRRAGRAQKEEDDRRAEEGKPPANRGKRKDRQ